MVRTVVDKGNGSVEVELANASPWSDGLPSTLRLWRMKCMSQSLGAVDTPVAALPKSSTRKVLVSLASNPGPADYFLAQANVNQTAPESDTSNNIEKSAAYTAKCTPK